MADADQMERARRVCDREMALCEAAIAWIDTPPYNQLNVHRLRQRLRRLETTLAIIKTNNDIIADGTADDNERQQLMDAFAAFDIRCMDAMASMEERMEELAAQQLIANQPAQAAANANVAQVQPPVPANDGVVQGPPLAANIQPPVDAAAAAAAAAAIVPPPVIPQVIQLQMPYQPESVQDTWGPFYGEQMQWFDWKAKFVLAVHNVEQMPVKNKLQHLAKALKGDALATISRFELSPENYPQIWEALVAAYEKRFPTACAYLNKFFALKKLDYRASPSDLQRMVNTTNELIRQIGSINYPIQHWDMVIVYALQARLNEHYATEWNKERNENEDPSTEDMLKFLSKMAVLAVNKGLTYAPMHVKITNEYASAGPSHRPQPAGAEGRKFPCPFCSSVAHIAPLCPQLTTKSLLERRSMVFSARLCVWCLKGGHFKHECFSGKHCNESRCQSDTKHHASLCPVKENRGPYDVAAAANFQRNFDALAARPPDADTHSSKGPSMPSSWGRGRGKRPTEQS